MKKWEMTSWDDLDKKAPDLQKLFNNIICGPGSMCAPILREAINHPEYKATTLTDDEQKQIQQVKQEKKEEKKKEILKEKSREAFCKFFTEKYKVDIADIPFIKSCWDFVDYQRGLYKDEDEDEFQREGFQIGNPWHGDILNSPILFLSSNPGITEYCLFPRWHPDRSNPEKDVFSLAGNPDKNKIVKLDYSKVSKEYGDSVEIMKSKYSDNKITPEKVYSFLANRFQESPHTQNSMNVWIKDEKGIIDIRRKKDGHANPVMYWGGMQDVVELLIDGYDVEDSASPQKLLTPVLSAEVVPFGSKKEDEFLKGKEGEKLIDYCWKKFTKRLLEGFLSTGKPKIIFLVGEPVKEAFFTNEFDECKRGKILNPVGTVYPFSGRSDCGTPLFAKGKKCCVAFIQLNNGRNFQGAVQLLRERAENDDTVIQGAIDDAREMMGL